MLDNCLAAALQLFLRIVAIKYRTTLLTHWFLFLVADMKTLIEAFFICPSVGRVAGKKIKGGGESKATQLYIHPCVFFSQIWMELNEIGQWRCRHLTISFGREDNSGIENKIRITQQQQQQSYHGTRIKCFIQGVVGSECQNWTTATVIWWPLTVINYVGKWSNDWMWLLNF